jgi:hypothetical protein
MCEKARANISAVVINAPVFGYGFTLQPIPLVEPNAAVLKSPQSFVRLGLINFFLFHLFSLSLVNPP